MRRTTSQLKKSARGNLLGNYPTVVGAFFLTVLISMLLDIPFSNMITQGSYFASTPRIITGVVGLVIVALLCLLLYTGINYIQLRLSRGKEVKFANILYPFQNQPGKFIGYGLLSYVLLAALLAPGLIIAFLSADLTFRPFSMTPIRPLLIHFIVPVLAVGIVIYCVIIISWSMTTYLLLDHPEYKVMNAIRRSRQMMKRKKWRMLFLMLSFLGWVALSVLSFFLALLWIIPYLDQSRICFYMNLLPEEEKKGRPEEETHTEENPWFNRQDR